MDIKEEDVCAENTKLHKKVAKLEEEVYRLRQILENRLDSHRAKEAPMEDAKETSLENAKENSLEDAKETSLEDAKETSLEGAKETSLEDSNETSLEDAKETNLEDAKETSLEEAKDTSLEDVKKTPLKNIKGTPLEDATQEEERDGCGPSGSLQSQRRGVFDRARTAGLRASAIFRNRFSFQGPKKLKLKEKYYIEELPASFGKSVFAGLKELTLPSGLSEEQLKTLLKPLMVLKRLNVSCPAEGTGGWLGLLPASLNTLDITGPRVPLDPPLPVNRRPDRGLYVCLRYASDKLLNHVTAALPSLTTGLAIHLSPGVTAGGLESLLSGLTRLEDVTLGMDLLERIDTALSALQGCYRLRVLQLGGSKQRRLDVSPEAVSSLVNVCRHLSDMYLNIDVSSAQTVLDALVETDLGKNAYHLPRGVKLNVSGEVYNNLTLSRLSTGTRIKVVSLG